MAVSVLVMTPVRSFGELIQQALQETGLYRVSLVGGDDQALEHVRTQKFPVAVLDFDLDSNPSDLVEALYELDPNLRIIAIKDETDAVTSIMADLRLSQHLDTPFYLPDLLDALDVVTADFKHLTDQSIRNGPPRAFPSSFLEGSRITAEPESPEWLDDVSMAAIHLTRLSLESGAQAALITRNAQLWAYAGHLPHPAAEELAQFVGLYWNREGGGDFARFIRLDSVSEEYILYATSLGGDFVLALAFDVEIPFTKIRSQAKGLAKRLANAPQEEITIDDVTDIKQADIETEDVSGEITERIPAEGLLDGASDEFIEFPTDWRPDQGAAESRHAFFEDLLSTVEIIEPDGQPVHPEDIEDIPQENAADNDFTEKVAIPEELPEAGEDEDHPDLEVGVSPYKDEAGLQDGTRPTLHPSIVERAGLDTQTQDGVVPNYLIETLPTPMPDYLKDTVPTPTRFYSGKFRGDQNLDDEINHRDSAYSQLTYACVLAPKLLYHHLVGDLATFLNRCVIQVGKAFGWQLEHLAIRPNYLHWVIAIPPGSSPGYMVRIMRDHTSHRVFSQFPHFARENITGDFWASGYLIVNGKYPLSHQLVEDFITKIRDRQDQPHHHSLTDI
jgi:REP element-mobilizing transposase RayT/ActR/RegA family two-component response regulator